MLKLCINDFPAEQIKQLCSNNSDWENTIYYPKVIRIMHNVYKKWLNVGQRNVWLHQPWPIQSQVNWGYVTHPQLHMEDNL